MLDSRPKRPFVQLTYANTKGIERQLARIADALELWMAYSGISVRPVAADQRGEPPDVSYVDEQRDALREAAEALGYAAKREHEEVEQ
jgi:hypothetical protein